MAPHAEAERTATSAATSAASVGNAAAALMAPGCSCPRAAEGWHRGECPLAREALQAASIAAAAAAPAAPAAAAGGARSGDGRAAGADADAGASVRARAAARPSVVAPPPAAVGDAGNVESSAQTSRRVRQRRGSTMVSVEAPSQNSHWLRCGICSEEHAFVAASSGGLLRHISTQHRGVALDRRQVRQLQYLGKVACADCGAFRDHKSAMCGQCGHCTRQRAIRVGDRVSGQPPTSASASSAQQAAAPAEQSGPPPEASTAEQGLPVGSLADVQAEAVDAWDPPQGRAAAGAQRVAAFSP